MSGIILTHSTVFSFLFVAKMAQAAMAAASSHDEDSSESRMVVTFLMSALESMVRYNMNLLYVTSTTGLISPGTFMYVHLFLFNHRFICKND